MNIPREARSTWVVAALIGAAFGGPETDVRAAAAAAGTLFEATPFVLAAWVASRAIERGPRPAARFVPWLGLAGCGCARGAIPGALALPAVALCAITFGPLVTLARTGAALARGAVRLRADANAGVAGTCAASQREDSDPFATLGTLATSAFVASLALEMLGAPAARLPGVAAFTLGAGLGIVAPCATAGVAIAAGLAHRLPWVCAGVLATAGLVTPFDRFRPIVRAAQRQAAIEPAPGACVLLAIALATLAVRGPSGLVNPRLLVPIACAALAALALRGTLRTRRKRPWLVPVLMLGCVLAPQPDHMPRAQATSLGDAFPGENLTFTGMAAGSNGRTTLARYVITCCRIDAAPEAVRLARGVAVRDGTWMQARGTLVRDPAGALVLRADDVRRVPAPADPFFYR